MCHGLINIFNIIFNKDFCFGGAGVGWAAPGPGAE